MCASFLQLKVLNFRVDQLPMSNTVTGLWSSLVRLSGSGDGAFSSFLTSTAPPNLLSAPVGKGASKRLDCKGNCIMTLLKAFYMMLDIDVTSLRQQQIRLGLLKAARVLFSQQENLIEIMTNKTTVIEDDYQYSLFQQLLSAATRPSPVKAMFGKEELEVLLLFAIVIVIIVFPWRLLLCPFVSI